MMLLLFLHRVCTLSYRLCELLNTNTEYRLPNPQYPVQPNRVSLSLGMSFFHGLTIKILSDTLSSKFKCQPVL